ncbi:MAG: succinate dehydrogenase, hydrophobic membrane anchor protein [Bauldia sp.]
MKSMRTPLSRVLHLGSARSGTEHFWRQRLTGAANVPLVVGLLVIVVTTVGQPYETAVTFLGSPWVAAVLVLFFLSVAIHMRIGMQVVVEDYIHGEGLKIVLLAASTFFSFGVAAVAILAILKLTFGV